MSFVPRASNDCFEVDKKANDLSGSQIVGLLFIGFLNRSSSPDEMSPIAKKYKKTWDEVLLLGPFFMQVDWLSIL
ncbi:hypothetical protein [Rossellomorea marisflavi]|uniref:hypothetical protein n=1 Tax=Rossellomorea marisflavi TaxID=189381 RepID=UPI00064EA3D1|nr:hypothetical protein [Rossellomorea marisflavi]KML32500.1 hypothetical protein VL12_14580 [Rossellomorea marisflavi]